MTTMTDDAGLADLLDRLLGGGVVVEGEITLAVTGVDLVYVGVRAILASVETALEPCPTSTP